MAVSVRTQGALCLLLTVALGSAASPCCWPKVFEGKIGISIGQVSPIAAGSQTMLADGTIHADWNKNKKVAVLERVYNSAYSIDLKVIEDLEAKVMYIIQEKQQKCQKIPLPPVFLMDPCVSKAMTLKGTQKLGLGPESLNVNVYETNKTDTFVKVYMTQKQCLPVFESMLVPIAGSKQAQGQVYSDLSLSIKDPSVFTIPDYCQQKVPPMVSNQVIKDTVARHRARRSLWA